jgi:hypothetical protein
MINISSRNDPDDPDDDEDDEDGPTADPSPSDGDQGIDGWGGDTKGR